MNLCHCCWRGWRVACSARFSSAAFGGLCARASRPNSRRFGSSAACCCERALSLAGFYLVAQSAPWAAAGLSPWFCHRAHGRDANDPEHATHRRPAMRLSPDQMILWQHGFLKLNGTIVFTWALMLLLAIGSKLITRNLSTELTRSRWQNLLEMVVTGMSTANRGSRPAATRRLISASSARSSCSSPWPASAPSFPVTSRRPVRSRPPPRWRSASSWPCRSSASRTRASAATSSPIRSRQSSCCRSISSASFRARWPWRSGSSAT